MKKNRKVKDFYFKKAKKEGYPARSIYKLEEIDKRFKLLKNGSRVLELGASPGGWTKYAAKRVGKDGIVVAIDINPLKIKLASNIIFFKEDIFELDTDMLKDYVPFDVILSDLAPRTTGIKDVDAYRSYVLSKQALEMADGLLSKGGNFVTKIFMGAEFGGFIKELKMYFKAHKVLKPRSSRSESREIFVIGLSKR